MRSNLFLPQVLPPNSSWDTLDQRHTGKQNLPPFKAADPWFLPLEDVLELTTPPLQMAAQSLPASASPGGFHPSLSDSAVQG